MATKRHAITRRRHYMRDGRPTRHNKRKFTIPLAIVAGLAPGVINTVQNGMANGWTGKSPDNAMAVFLRNYTGIQTAESQAGYQVGSWSPWALKYGLYPALGGFAAHYLAQKVGLNRMLARAGIPIVRI